uniref:Cytochrome c oxidase subunit 3 n=1 Tax=Modiolus modiolus TaxID=40256 RepID=A0A1L7H866_MODMO|nr:cytochrome c oxidase subunit 3 [Modiolus modiolus]
MSRNPYFLPGMSPWPILVSLSSLSAVLSLLLWFESGEGGAVLASALGLSLALGQWWRDVMREGALGYHSLEMVSAFVDGFVLFLASEVMFFFSLFWAFFHCSLAPDISIGCVWPPLGIEALDPMKIPLLGTILLLSSGVSVTMALKWLSMGYKKEAFWGVGITVALGGFFSGFQLTEYYMASFTIADSVYGSLFYIITGFHGFHVVVGLVFLLVIFTRIFRGSISSRKHFSFMVCSWYWHFVDVVWILVYFVVYIWGG